MKHLTAQRNLQNYREKDTDSRGSDITILLLSAGNELEVASLGDSR
jgi:hypothetical protein